MVAEIRERIAPYEAKIVERLGLGGLEREGFLLVHDSGTFFSIAHRDETRPDSIETPEGKAIALQVAKDLGAKGQLFQVVSRFLKYSTDPLVIAEITDRSHYPDSPPEHTIVINMPDTEKTHITMHKSHLRDLLDALYRQPAPQSEAANRQTESIVQTVLAGTEVILKAHPFERNKQPMPIWPETLATG